MTQGRRSTGALVAVFLPFDANAVDAVFREDDDVDVLAASLGSFTVAALAVLSSLDAGARRTFCHRVSALSEGDVQPWMAEAALRNVEGDQDALVGIDPVVMSGIHVYGLHVITTEYLTVQECVDLRRAAAQKAEILRPGLATLPR